MSILTGDSYSAAIKKALLVVLNRLEAVPDSLPTEHMFFSSEFEKQSNLLRIGVKSKSVQVGNVLQFFLRMITDENFCLALWVFDDLEDDDKRIGDFSFSPDEMIAKYEIQENDQRLMFPIDKCAEAEMCNAAGTYKISHRAEDIDLWDLSRIRQAVENKDFSKVDFM